MFGRKPGSELFDDRRDAGRQLAGLLAGPAELARMAGPAGEDPVVLALPRGGVPVAAEIAVALGTRLEIFAVRKLGAPFNPEYGIGAIAEDRSRLLDSGAIRMLGISEDEVESIAARESAELKRQVDAFRGGRPAPELRDRTVIVVDDGVATGLTDTVALRAIRRMEPLHLTLAVPVCPAEAAVRLEAEADQVLSLPTPAGTHAIGQCYRDFSQVSDDRVISILDEAGRP